MLDAVVVYPAVDLLGAHAWADMLGHVIECSDVDLGRCLDALDFLGRFEQVASEDDLARII